MYSISGTTINLTKGDTLRVAVSIICADGTEYIPQEGDTLRFAMKKTFRSSELVLLKEIPIDTMLLTIDPEDTKNLSCRNYVYDVELTTRWGDVDTIIPRAVFWLTEEVY